MKKGLLGLVICIFIVVGCTSDDEGLYDPTAERIPPLLTNPSTFADANINQEARDLYTRLLSSTQEGIAFGQQDPFGTGNDFPMPDKLDKDFMEVTGDYPAVVGFDLELIGLQNSFFIEDFYDRFVSAVIDAHENGSIITISWHMINLNTFFGTDDSPLVVAKLLENGELRDDFLRSLEWAAVLLNRLVDSNGNSIPVLFRPWHEMNGDFFWWGEGFRTTEQYVQLFRDTVRILSEDFNVHNLIYVYAPNLVSDQAEYMRNYPGDDFVDMLGVDVYDFENGNFLQSALRNLQIVEEIATDKNMLFALTETGLTNVTQNDWWTQSLYKAIRSSSITYAMIWRNDKPTFFHAPFVGHPSVGNFRTFLDKDVMLLSSDLP